MSTDGASAEPGHVTLLLRDVRDGRDGALERLMEAVYPDLRKLARAVLRDERPGQALQATSLVHEAYLRLAGRIEEQDWSGRAHLMAIAARVMRQALVDRARKRDAHKRGGDTILVPISEADGAAAAERSLDVIALEEALARLGALHERQERVVELRYFAGLTMDEIAHVLDVSLRTVEDDWFVAKAFLRAELEG